MSTMYSYSSIERDILPEFKMKLSKSEDGNDVKNLFSQTIYNMLKKVFEDNKALNVNDVKFEPELEHYFSITNPDIMSHEVYEKSDLKNIIMRFANTSYDRYVHLKKHNEKTNLKIRN